MAIKRYIHDLASLFFPQACLGCDTPLMYGEHLICTDCWYHLPYTHAHLDIHNPGARQLWGRVPMEAVASYLYFVDSSRVKRIMHHLKYRRCPQAGELLGSKYGELLRETAPFNGADIIVPVPLHPSKLRKRGYNQSAFFAKGLSCSMGKAVGEHVLVRSRATESQTRKSRYQRYENMVDTFSVCGGDAVVDKHVLLVDDVLTTGATLEACAHALLTGGAARVSAVTIAKAR